jgi:hypothetical protein
LIGWNRLRRFQQSWARRYIRRRAKSVVFAREVSVGAKLSATDWASGPPLRK